MKRIAILIVLAHFSQCGQSSATHVDPADARIHYQGRWDHKRPSKPWCAWQGSAISASFRGTKIQAVFGIDDKPEHIRVILDSNGDNSRKLKLTPGKQVYTLASDLEPGEHRIEIVKETYTGKGHLTFHGFTVDGQGLLERDYSQTQLRIVFYGDSNLAGYSLESEKNDGDPTLRGCYYSFAGIASRMLGAEYHNISSSGATINGRPNSVLSFHSRVDRHRSEPRWDFDSFPADICVVNIGANDINFKSKEQIKKDFKTLLSALREAHPKANIVLMNGYGWSRNEPANYTHEVVSEMGDVRLSRVIFPWLFNEWHGCEYDHAGMAQALVDHLASLDAKWNQVRPIDVMNGFGRDDNVANGSFELVAPFGGYGWRYCDDGAQRVHDPEGSADGEWFLRLPEGQQVHQPNPASAGERYAYRLRIRGRQRDSQAHARVEFRDQEWRHEVPDSARDFVLTTQATWKEYTISVPARARSQPPNPSRDPWQIIIRLEALAGTVDIDDVRLSVIR